MALRRARGLPTSRKITSPSSRCWAHTDVASKTTTAYRRSGKKTAKLWSVDGWHRVAGLAADCEHFVIGFPGANLLPDPYDPGTAMLSFFRNGTLIRTVALNQLVKDLSKLKKTASHWEWGCYVGVERKARYRVGTVDQGEIVFDMTTGLPIDRASRPRRDHDRHPRRHLVGQLDLSRVLISAVPRSARRRSVIGGELVRDGVLVF